MSGFAGIIRLEPSLESADADRATIARMAQAIAFRGPDAQQQWSQNGASFAFSLLTTGPAPQAASQPVTLDGNTWLLGDVRCDGRDDLIVKLEQHGVSVSRSASSEELVLHWFATFGETAFPDLEGDFSFVLWQVRERRLLAFRDLMGARPFFYSYSSGLLCFSNTMQAVLASPNIQLRNHDLQYIGDFLLGAPHHDQELSVYRDVRRLPAGYLLEFSLRGLHKGRIAVLPVENLLRPNRDEQVVEEFRRLFTQAVCDRLPEDDASIFLSGGLDSTCIAATIAALHRGSKSARSKLRALCVDFQPLFDDDESQFASAFANAFGIPLQIVHSGDCLPFADWQHSFPVLPEPLMDPFCSLYLSYRQEISKKARVVFSGDGGDEILRLPAAPYLKFLAGTGGLVSAAASLARWTISNRRLPSLGFGIRSGFLRRLGYTSPELKYPTWLSPDFESDYGLPQRWKDMCAPLPPHPFNPKAYHAMNSGLFADVQEMYDPTWTRVPLETRSPFLDRRLVRFLLRIPAIPWAMSKQLLRVAHAGIIPEEIRCRPKTPVPQDPLVLHVASGNWNPSSVPHPPEKVRSLVDWPGVMQSLIYANDTALYVHLRPVALSFWLKAVENDHCIQ